jgi:uncharacterized protein
MRETFVYQKKSPGKLRNPVLITGLPGIGLVGQVVCKYIISKMGGKKIADIYSPHFPHQVFMTKKGALRQIKNMVYLVKCKNCDMVLLIGDVQAITSEGQYEVAGKILDYAQKLGVKKVISIGGYSIGKIEQKRRVFAVVTKKSLVAQLKKFGVVFGAAKGAIVGAAGLIPSMARFRDMEGMCLMGETHGSYVDASAAHEVLNVLEKFVGFSVDHSDLEKQAKAGEKIIRKIEEEVQRQSIGPYTPDKGGISYIR